MIRLLGASDIRGIAAQLGVRPTKKLGQNFVVEPGTVRQIAGIAAPREGDVVLEVGPGLGSLTLALLERVAEAGARLIAVEIDPVLAAALPGTIADRAPDLAHLVDVVHADALRLAETGQLPAAPTVLAANLPYNVAVPVVLHLLATFPSLQRGVVMVQAEVADRMCAAPGSRVYGGPSAKLAWYGTAKSAGTVPRSVFWPVPNVDSKLVSFTRGEVPDTGADRRETFAVIEAAFGQRRKTLRSALATWAGSPAEAERLLRAAGVDPGARGEALGVADFARIGQARKYDLQFVAKSVTVRVPAKINLQLAVGPLRGDGYHDLVTVFHAISLSDEVTVAAADQDSVVVSGEGADQVPADRDNLALKAVSALRAVRALRGVGSQDPAGVAVRIAKRIPVAAGLAGGSADAAATLVACNELWHAEFSQQDLCEVAGSIGSDVPFAIIGGTAVGRGRGEQLTAALVSQAKYHWVLAFADGGLSTPEVYRTLDRLRGPAPAPAPELSNELMAALRAGDPGRLGRSLSNDLQAPAISMFPALRKTLDAGLELGALGGLVSGSGPSCFFLARSGSHATELAAALSGAGVCRGVARASGPASGAVTIDDAGATGRTEG
jgi:16S rRNA (adenine1518-N6/adenine1519-N6)-dimethyltransferase